MEPSTASAAVGAAEAACRALAATATATGHESSAPDLVTQRAALPRPGRRLVAAAAGTPGPTKRRRRRTGGADRGPLEDGVFVGILLRGGYLLEDLRALAATRLAIGPLVADAIAVRCEALARQLRMPLPQPPPSLRRLRELTRGTPGLLIVGGVVTGHSWGSWEGPVTVIIPWGVTSIGAAAFQSCRSLVAVHVPATVTRVSHWVFSNCTSLAAVHIPDSVADIGHGAFSGCTSLTAMHIPDAVTRIGHGAFRDCSSLVYVRIPDTVTRIGQNAFRDCTSLADLRIRNSATHIGEGAFSGCPSVPRCVHACPPTHWSTYIRTGLPAYRPTDLPPPHRTHARTYKW